MSGRFEHIPVMVDEVIAAMGPVPSLPVVDTTVGGAGHAEAILEAYPDRRLVGFDQDPVAVEVATERLSRFGERAEVHQASFRRLYELASASALSRGGVGAVLFDLGVSSYQLDTALRGFSFRQEGPLDMRMDPSAPQSAADIVNTWSAQELARLFFSHGETRLARRLARAIVEARPITTTVELASVVERATPAAARRRGHPARRVFQALRVTVNEELDILGPAIDDAIALLAPGGRVIVLSYHSGEDRIVKDRLENASTGGCRCPVGLPCVCGAQPLVRLLNRGARMPSDAEVERNPRAESARLRVAEKLEPPASESPDSSPKGDT